jgi:hypothetical protein
MSKFATRLLTLIMYATSLPAISMITSAQAETSNSKQIKQQHRKNIGFREAYGQAWPITEPYSQLGPVCPGIARSIDCRIWPPPFDEDPDRKRGGGGGG